MPSARPSDGSVIVNAPAAASTRQSAASLGAAALCTRLPSCPDFATGSGGISGVLVGTGTGTTCCAP